MNPILLAVTTWFHLLATVIMIGLYLLMFFAITPGAIAVPAYAGLVVDAYRRTKPYLLGSWVVFALSGVGLMLVNDQYKGLGQFNNTWSILMLVKHVVVFAMIMMTGFTNLCPVIGVMRPLETALTRKDDTQIQTALRSLHARERITMLLGVAVLLLTAAAATA